MKNVIIPILCAICILTAFIEIKTTGTISGKTVLPVSILIFTKLKFMNKHIEKQ